MEDRLKKLLVIATLNCLGAGSALAQTATPTTRMPPPPPAAGAEAPPAQVNRTIQMTDEEIRVTIQMLDECVKAQGMRCAEPAVTITRKLQAALPKP
jgi:hypothetical protein